MTSLSIDVLIPTYNPGPEHLRVALDALKNQTYQNWKAFIHDESTEGDVQKIVEPYLADPRFRFKKSDRRLGIGGNWNACLKATSAPVVAYLFHDDEWGPKYLERAMHVLEAHATVGLVSMNHTYRIEGAMVTANEYTELQEWKRKNLQPGIHAGKEYLWEWVKTGLKPNIIGEPSFCVLRRSVMDQIGIWNETMPQSLDAEYWVRILEVADWFYQPEDSGFFRVHEEGTTAVNRRAGKGLYDRFQILQSLIDRLSSGPERTIAKRAQIRQFQDMVKRYFQKRDRGDSVTFSGSGIVKKFALRHPFVTGWAVMKR
ncbi:MAG: glycosyltransferase family A protein [Candidatus Peregrinibacteria bacterium]